MKIRILLLVVCSFLSTLVFSQLPDGTEGPNWTLTDLDGNTHELYSVLEEGKSVIIDFSATWCGTCWNYHKTNALENVYLMYGPDGTDKVRVYWMDADANTNDACVTNSMGCSSSTKGDWTAGSAHPYFNLEGDDLSVKSDYNINSYPTIIGIAPNKKQYEIGKLTDMNTWDSWINESFAMDYSFTSENNSINLEVIAGFGNKTFLWSNGETTANITDLPPGAYTCTITDERGHCITTESIFIADSNLSISCPEPQSTICSLDNLPAYSTVLQFLEAGGDISGQYDPNSFEITTQESDGNCPETITRVYKIANTDGASQTCTQDIIVNDEIAPTISFSNSPIVVALAELDAALISSYEQFLEQGGSVTDDCGVNENINLVSESSDNMDCELITYTYSITDHCGNASTFEQDVYVRIQETAELDFDYQVDGLKVVFENTNNYGATAFAWTFGDMSFTTVPNPEHTYNDYGVYEVCLIASSICADQDICVNIELKKPVGLEDLDLNQDIDVYPSPASDRFYIQSRNPNYSIEKTSLFNAQGHLVKTKTEVNRTMEMEVQDLSSGIYLLKIETNRGLLVKKVIIL